MYTVKDYNSRKELLADFKAGKKIPVYQPGPFPGHREGQVCLEGPHYPKPHKWYATATIKDCIITGIK